MYELSGCVQFNQCDCVFSHGVPCRLLPCEKFRCQKRRHVAGGSFRHCLDCHVCHHDGRKSLIY